MIIWECAKILLNAGAIVNVRDDHGQNALEICIGIRISRRSLWQPKHLALMLFAAGEKVLKAPFRWKYYQRTYCVNVRTFLQKIGLLQRSLRLTDMCRDRIRKHLIKLNNVNLFVRVRQLGLPVSLASFVVYNVSLE